MDPNQFFLDYDRLFEVLITIVVFSFFVERALSVLFESKWFIERYSEKNKILKEIIALFVSISVCWSWKLDAISIIVVSHSEMQIPGFILTGAIVAGGSKGSIKLFKDIMGFMSNAEKARLAAKKCKD